MSSIVAILFFIMVYSINHTYRESEVNVIKSLFSVDFVVSVGDSDDEDDEDDGGGEEDDEDEYLYGYDEALQQLWYLISFSILSCCFLSRFSSRFL